MYQAFKNPIHFHHYWLSIFKWRSRLTVIIRHFVNTFHDIDVANPSALFNSNERNFVLVTFLKLLSQREGYLSFPHTWFCAFLKNSLVCQSLQISHSSFQPKKYRRNKWFKNHLSAVLPNYTNIVSIGVRISFWITFFSRYIPSSRIAGSYGSPILRFLRNLHTILYSEVKVAQSCPILCNPMDYTVHGILQARIFPNEGSNPGFPHASGFFTSWAARNAQEHWSG